MAGIEVDVLSENDVILRVRNDWREGLGGWIVTANIDILRLAASNTQARRLVAGADLVVVDGMPVRWAIILAGRPMPERVTGASLFWRLSQSAAEAGQSVFVVGGPPGAAEAAARALVTRYPVLKIAGVACPPIGFEDDPTSLHRWEDEIVSSDAGLVLLGLGFPKQERIIEAVRPRMPHTWFLGCGAAISFAAGDVARAPLWMQQAGLEWLHRLAQEPLRLGRRYLLQDASFAIRLLTTTAAGRLRDSHPGPAHDRLDSHSPCARPLTP